MKSPRKTKAEREQESTEANRQIWKLFRARLDALTSFAEAKALVDESPPPDAPGRRYYSNLEFFLQAFIPPANSSHDEKFLYIQLIQRMDDRGELKLGVRDKVERDLRKAMDAQAP
jgi:hypothetical protein